MQGMTVRWDAFSPESHFRYAGLILPFQEMVSHKNAQSQPWTWELRGYSVHYQVMASPSLIQTGHHHYPMEGVFFIFFCYFHPTQGIMSKRTFLTHIFSQQIYNLYFSRT